MLTPLWLHCLANGIIRVVISWPLAGFVKSFQYTRAWHAVRVFVTIVDEYPKGHRQFMNPPLRDQESDDADVVKVAHILQGPSGLPLEEFRLKRDYMLDDVPTKEPIACSWLIYPRSTGLTVIGNVKADLSLECIRCLTPYSVPLSLELEEEYMFSRFTEESQGKEKELQADDFYETIDENGVLDLRDLLRQFLLLEAENHAYCGREDCHFVDPGH
jgi:uncharacterized metal-binding protein YceD (DUF177 family)